MSVTGARVLIPPASAIVPQACELAINPEGIRAIPAVTLDAQVVWHDTDAHHSHQAVGLSWTVNGLHTEGAF